AEDHLSWVHLASDGWMFATDGYGLLLSKNAHDAEQDVYIKALSRARMSQTGERYEILTDEDTLIEYRSRSQERYDVEIASDVKYPGVHRRVPTHLTAWPKAIPPYDSIRAGKMAADYGLNRGIWTGGPSEDSVHLLGVADTDLVILAAVDIQ
ncbi:MAG: hypothetical protein LC687_02310, partial [Actinobacteria bacterium]|nr:hypothetical protein [Actinomycetota bacterium]